MKDAVVASSHIGSAGGVEESTQHKIRPVTVTIGDTPVALSLLNSKEEPAGNAAGKPIGVIGNDVLFGGNGYQLDFKTMHFRLLEK